MEIKSSKILVAEDSPINMQVIKNQFHDLQEFNRCVFCFDGMEALNSAKKIIGDALKSQQWTIKV